MIFTISLTHCIWFACFSPGALLKACFCLLDIVTLPSNETLSEQLGRKYQAGFELHTWSTAPQGSGLGTSSILAGVILMALLRVTDRTTSMESLIHAVLIIEQMLTTGGGWQDNVGGLVPGFKIGRSQASLPLKVEWEKLDLSEKTVEEITKRLVCFYSGRTRLAKNLLQVKQCRASCERKGWSGWVCEQVIKEGTFYSWSQNALSSYMAWSKKKFQLVA